VCDAEDAGRVAIVPQAVVDSREVLVDQLVDVGGVDVEPGDVGEGHVGGGHDGL
jgi:hypothetical protein